MLVFDLFVVKWKVWLLLVVRRRMLKFVFVVGVGYLMVRLWVDSSVGIWLVVVCLICFFSGLMEMFLWLF